MNRSDIVRFVDERPGRALLAIALFGLVLRVLVSLFLPVTPASDFAWYYERAQEIAAGLGFQEHGVPTAYWPVGYPAILAGLFLLFGSSVAAGIAGNMAFAFCTFLLIAKLGEALGLSPRARLLAVAIWAVYPNAVFYTPQLASEGPYVPLLIAAIWLTLDPRKRFNLLAGLLFGIATLIKAQTYLFPIGLFVMMALFDRSRGWKSLAASALIVHVALFAVLTPWALRNQQQLGSPVLVSTNGGITLLNGNNPYAVGGYINEKDVPEIEAIYAQTGISREERIVKQVEFDKRAKALGRQWIAEHPAQFVALMPRKLLGLWLVDGDAAWEYERQYPPAAASTIRAARILNQALYAAILLASLAMLVLLVRDVFRRQRAPLLLLYAFPVFITLIALVFSGQTRFHGPAMPFLILASVALIDRWRWAKPSA